MLDAAAGSFWHTPTLLTWIQSLFRDVPLMTGAEMPAQVRALAAFLALMDGLRRSDICPEVTFMRPEGRDIDVHLVLDLGNSRACGILLECPAGEEVQLDESRKLEIRDLTNPGLVYSEPFDTSFKFYPPLFFDPKQPVPHAGTSFHWPSLVRLGREAARLEPCSVGDSGMSSPKRYLWDDRERSFPWYFNLADSGIGRKITAPFLKYLDADGSYKGDKAAPPFEPRYPAGAMMTFLVLELLNHASAQINGFDHRRIRGHRLARRVLRNLVFTVPNGMSPMERDRYRQRIQDAVDIFGHVWGIPADLRPRILLDLDEATSVQLTYLFGEIRHRFLGDVRETVRARGLCGNVDEHNEPLLRLASIDIGGGTSDLMIAEYGAHPANASTVVQRKLFSEGFSVAGDEMAKRIIEKLILPQVFEFARRQNPDIPWTEFQSFFGPGRGGRDRAFIEAKAELCRQVWIPMSHRFLEFVESDVDQPVIELSFDRFFADRLPGMGIQDFFTAHMKDEFGVSMTLAEIPWMISAKAVNAVIVNVMERVLRLFAEIIGTFGCDCLILGGKPSSLPVIRDLLLRLMPVPSMQILPLKGYPVGNWYPFAQRGGGIADPKTTCVVGGAVWLFAQHLEHLEGVRFEISDGGRTTAPFLGVFHPLSLRLEQILFSQGSRGPVDVDLSKPLLLGIRRIDSDLCPANPLWEIAPETAEASGNGNDLPWRVTLSQDAVFPEGVAIENAVNCEGKRVPKDRIRLGLRTLVQERYWLDTGNFDL